MDIAKLRERLLEHADCHANVTPYDDEQAQWERDLRDAASLLARLEAAEGLAKAADYALWQHNGGGTAIHNHWSAVLSNALTTYNQEKARG